MRDEQRNKAKRGFFVLGVMVIVGLVMLPIAKNLYTNLVYRREVSQLERVFPDTNPHFQETLQQLGVRVQNYNREIAQVAQEPPLDPFTHEQPSFDLSEYDIYDYIIGFITIERINITLPILLGANAYGLERGAVLLTESSFPIGGIPSNAIIAAHRNAETVMFRDLDRLSVGDRIVIRNLWDILDYQVVETRIIEAAQVRDLTIQRGRDLVTLITEHPRSQGSQRLVVICERIIE